MKIPSDTALCMRLLLGAIAAMIMVACASIGTPEGGPIDELPPVFVKSNPAPNTLNFTRDKLAIEFDENVQIKDPITKVTVSPVQKLPPRVSAVAKKIVVELRDTMIPNTTYTIDFADAISDLNEGNEIDGFSIAFSTGSEIDTLCISGMVLQASNLEPAQGMLVGAYSNLSDTAIRTLPMERITKTNQFGQFTLRNLKAGTYRIYALNDMNRDYKWDRTEDVAFYDVTIDPRAEQIHLTDTIKSQSGADSIVVRPATQFLPNDVLLTWFNEGYKSQYLMKYERPTREKLSFLFGAKADTLPAITLLNGGEKAGLDISKWTKLNASPTLDTLEYWITDTTVLALDTIMVAARFLRTDSLEQLSWGTDTLKIVQKGLKKKKAVDPEKEKKDKEKAEKEKAEKEKEKDKDHGKDALPEGADTLKAPEPEPEITFTSLSFSSPGTQDLNKGLSIKTTVPIARFDTSMVTMQKLVDTLWVDIPAPIFHLGDSLRPMAMYADYVWEPGTKYKVVIDSLALTDIYGLFNKPLKHELTTRKIEDYGTIDFNLRNVNGPAMVELLNSQDKPVAQEPVKNGHAVFRYVLPGTYYARMWFDANDNGIYDNGILDSIQPEEVYYFPKKLNLKKNWDIDQPWDIYEVPVDMQKPSEIKKNKPKPKRGELNNNTSDEDEDDDYYDPSDPFGANRNSNRNSGRGGNNRFNTGGFGGGVQQMGNTQAGLRR